MALIGDQPAPEGGGSLPGTDVPVAAGLGVASVDTTTYDNTITGSGKFTTLVLPVDNAVMAIAIEGDAFPRWVMDSDPFNLGLQWGDGTVPLDGSAGAILDLDGSNGDGSMIASLGSAHGALNTGRTSTQYPIGRVDTSQRAIEIGASTVGKRIILSGGSGSPVGVQGGNVGDVYIRADGDGTLGQLLYRCTVAGAPAAATWVSITD